MDSASYMGECKKCYALETGATSPMDFIDLMLNVAPNMERKDLSASKRGHGLKSNCRKFQGAMPEELAGMKFTWHRLRCFPPWCRLLELID